MNFSIENSNLEGGFSDISDRGFKGQNAPGLQEARGGENSIEEQGSLEERWFSVTEAFVWVRDDRSETSSKKFGDNHRYGIKIVSVSRGGKTAHGLNRGQAEERFKKESFTPLDDLTMSELTGESRPDSGADSIVSDISEAASGISRRLSDLKNKIFNNGAGS